MPRQRPCNAESKQTRFHERAERARGLWPKLRIREVACSGTGSEDLDLDQGARSKGSAAAAATEAEAEAEADRQPEMCVGCGTLATPASCACHSSALLACLVRRGAGPFPALPVSPGSQQGSGSQAHEDINKAQSRMTFFSTPAFRPIASSTWIGPFVLSCWRHSIAVRPCALNLLALCHCSLAAVLADCKCGSTTCWRQGTVLSCSHGLTKGRR